MKIMGRMKSTKALVVFLAAMSLSLTGVAPLYSGIDESMQRNDQSSSSVFAPGYSNAAKYRAQAIANQINSNPRPQEEKIEAAADKTADEVREDAATKAEVTLKKKTGGPEANRSSTDTAALEAARKAAQEAAATRPEIVNKTDLGNGTFDVEFNNGKHTTITLENWGQIQTQAAAQAQALADQFAFDSALQNAWAGDLNGARDRYINSVMDQYIAEASSMNNVGTWRMYMDGPHGYGWNEETQDYEGITGGWYEAGSFQDMSFESLPYWSLPLTFDGTYYSWGSYRFEYVPNSINTYSYASNKMNENWDSINARAGAYAASNEAKQHASDAVTNYIKSNYSSYGLGENVAQIYGTAYSSALANAWNGEMFSQHVSPSFKSEVIHNVSVAYADRAVSDFVSSRVGSSFAEYSEMALANSGLLSAQENAAQAEAAYQQMCASYLQWQQDAYNSAYASTYAFSMGGSESAWQQAQQNYAAAQTALSDASTAYNDALSAYNAAAAAYDQNDSAVVSAYSAMQQAWYNYDAAVTAEQQALTDYNNAQNAYSYASFNASQNANWAGQNAVNSLSSPSNPGYQDYYIQALGAVQAAQYNLSVAQGSYNMVLGNYESARQAAYNEAITSGSYLSSYNFATQHLNCLNMYGYNPGNYSGDALYDSYVSAIGFSPIADAYASSQANQAIQAALDNYASSIIGQERSQFVSASIDNLLNAYENTQLDTIIPGVVETMVQQQQAVEASIWDSVLARESAKAISNFGAATMSATLTVSVAAETVTAPQTISSSSPLSLSNSNMIDGGGIVEMGPADNMKIMGAFAASAPDISTIAAESIFTGANVEGNVDAFVMLADIVNSPTAEQKEALGAAMALLDEIDAMQKEGADPAKVAEMKNDVAKTVAATILAQALPDLLREGDVAAMRDSFAELGARKNELFAGYQAGVKPYYDEVRKDLAVNISALQLSNILSNGFTKKEIDLMPPNEIEKLIEKLRQMKERSSEIDYILQQEAKYKKKYVDPSREKLEQGMKNMLERFSSRVTAVITDASAAKKSAETTKASVR